MENEKDRVEPVLAAGLRDYLPADMIPRQEMLDSIRRSMENFGFVPLETPGIEKESVLLGGEENSTKQIFRLRTRTTREDDLALRFDLTVPLARVVSRYRSDIQTPFKRYQTGKVWRGEKPQAGRFREFTQFDADIVGVGSVAADAEIVSLMYETMFALGFRKFLIRINDRKILNGIPEFAGFNPAFIKPVLRIMDKMDKVGWDGVAQRLAGKIFAEDQEESDGEAPQEIVLPESAIAAIRRFVELKCGNPEETLRGVRDLMGGIGIAMEGVDELEAMIANIRGLSVPVGNWTVDLSVARGLGYYTGPVFETILTDLPGIGSVFSGGRYDDLVKRFTGLSVPATGASVGVDRLFAAMEQMNLVPQRRNLTQVGILNFDPACTVNCERIATQLRRGGIRTELYLGAEKLLKDQLTYFIKRDVAYIVILGGNENAKGVVQLKDTVKREQGEIGQDDLVRVLKAKLDIL